LAKLVFNGAASIEITITRRLKPIPGAEGLSANGGIAFTSHLASALIEGPGYVLVADDGSRREVSVGEYSYRSPRGYRLAFYLGTAVT